MAMLSTARVSLFYVLAVLIVGMLVASDDERLGEGEGTAAQSPFVIAASAAGIKRYGTPQRFVLRNTLGAWRLIARP
jgi:amino acid permease